MSLKISLKAADPLTVPADVAVIGIAEGASPRAGALGALSKALGPIVARTLKREEFTGKKDQSVEFATAGKLKASRVVLIGLGSKPLTTAEIRQMAAKASRLAQNGKAEKLAFELPFGVLGGERAAAEGLVLGAYRFKKYMTGDRVPKTALGSVTVTTSGKATKEAREALELGQQVGEAVCLSRDLINEPPNELYPETFAKFAQAVAKTHGLKCTVLGKAEMAKRNMNLVLAVSQGSVRDPKLIHFVYTPSGTKPKKKLVFVGKGLTFDSGGLCIKPAAGMEEMKGDMGGGANIVALMAAVALTKPDAEVHGLIGAVENMPDGAAYRPSDIFKAMNGKTVEIINTDAEGRLVLADVLAYACELKPDFILDNATLTGACVVALGTLTSAFYANRPELAEKMTEAAKTAGESMWHMPLTEELRDGLKSDWADLKHTADRWGGSITAALFLREFIGKTPWIHVDIAGPSMASRPYGIYSKGGTGHGVLSFLELINLLAAD